MPLDPKHETAINTYAQELGVDPDLARAVAEQESGSQGESAVSPKGAVGVMQVMPETSKELQPKYGPDRRRQGVGYLKQLEGSLQDVPDTERQHFTLAAYNAGPGRVSKARAKAKARGLDSNVYANVERFLPRETRDYVPGVLGRVRGASGATDVEPGVNVGGMSVAHDEDIRSLAGDADIRSLAGEQPADTGRSIGEMAKEYVPGLQGLTDLAKLAGHVSGIRPLDEAEFAEMAARGKAQQEHPIKTAIGAAGELAGVAVPALRPFTALGAAAGVGAEKATGSPTVGRVASVAVPTAASVGPGIARLAGKAAGLTKGPTAAEMVTKGLSAETTAQEVGRTLQAPSEGARAAIGQTADEASRLYGEAGQAAKAAGAAVPATERSILKAARAANRAGATGEARAAVNKIVRLGRGQKVNPGGGVTLPGAPVTAAGRAARQPVPVDQLINAQSELRRAINKMGYQDPARGKLVELSQSIDDAMGAASKGTPVGEKLGQARAYFRDVTVPTRKTMGRVTRAEEPEAATRTLTQTSRPTRFQRLEAQQLGPQGGKFVQPVEGVRSAAFNDMIQSATRSGKVDLRKLSTSLHKAEASGQLDYLTNTAARTNTIRAIKKAAKVQYMATKAPIVGGGTGALGGAFGIGSGFAIGRIIQAALTSEKASRALLRLASARQGTPGWQMAKTAFLAAAGTAAPTVSGGAARAKEQ